MQDGRGSNGAGRHWPEAGISRVPYWVYSDETLYARELARIF